MRGESHAAACVALTIAGSDPSGGAGLQADLKTFQQHGVYGASVVTLLTVQNTVAVREVRVLEPAFVLAQLEAVLADVSPAAAKTGALGSAAVIEAVARQATRFQFPLVVDPVMVSKHGDALMDAGAAEALRDRLLPCAFLVTPNIHEASALTGMVIDGPGAMIEAARTIARMGPRHVLIKGGGLAGEAADLLWSEGQPVWLTGPRVASTSTHGTGCVFSAAITARLAGGEGLPDAARSAKGFVTRAIAAAPGIGHGRGPINLLVPPDEP